MTGNREPIPGGWIKLHRCIQQSPLWMDKPFDRARAWIDLLLLANSKAGTIQRRGIKITVLRGEVGHSLRALGERWGWSLGKVQRFLHELKMDTQIDTRTDTENVNVTALIRLVNYDKYQSRDTKNDTKNDTKTGTEQEVKEKTYIEGGSFFHETGVLPGWVPSSEWADFVQMRKEIKKPLTTAGVKKAVAKLDELRKQGYQPGDVLNQSTLNNWRGIFPLKGSIPQAAESTQPRRKLEVVL